MATAPPTTTISGRKNDYLTIKPSMAWLVVFIPTLSYFLSTRLQSSGFRWGRSSSLGDRVVSSLILSDSSSISSTISRSSKSSSRSSTTTTNCKIASDIFFLASSCTDITTSIEQQQQQQMAATEVSLQHGLHLLYQGRGMQGIVASTWRHDEELGRGYLLVSQSHGNGRVWRWEVGGGPIAIGRSLHLEASGCRSNFYLPCLDPRSMEPAKSDLLQAGSGAIAIDFYQGEGDSYLEGALILAEWGEGRIIRMEESNGARTPLVIQVPDVCSRETREEDEEGTNANLGSTWTVTRRLNQPRSMLYTPYGDLLVADTLNTCGKAAIYRLSQAVHVDALDSLSASRKAHAWNETQHGHPVDVFYANNLVAIGAMAMDPSWLSMYVTAKTTEGKVVLLKIPIVAEDDEEENAEEEESIADVSTGAMDQRAQIVMDMTDVLGISEPGPLVVSEKGHVFMAVPDGVSVLSVSQKGLIFTCHVVATLPTPRLPTSLTLGDDKFLYIFANDSMFRIRTREGPVTVPTNLVVGKKADKK